jgi:hypothetical protein
MQRYARAFVLAGAACLVLVAGCATNLVVDSTVQSFSGLLALPETPSYRFDRLPLQEQPSQEQVEALADRALHKAGLRRDDLAPRYSVEVSARVQRTLSPWADPWDGWGWGGAAYPWGGYWRSGYGYPFPRSDHIWFQREVGVVVRDMASKQVVFESRAANDGPWMDNAIVIGAMFDAAMVGFPNPPPGVRHVNVNVQMTEATAQGASPATPAPTSAPVR